MIPLCADLYCGLGGWSDGFLPEGYDCIGFDIERHDYGTGGYPGQLVLQDILTLHGSQFRDAACIVASPPCQEFSYMAMPFSRGKRIAAALRGQGEFPDGYTGSRTVAELTRLFDACFRIQREAIEATGKDCPACQGEGKRQRDPETPRVCPRCNGTRWITRFIPLIVENVRGAQPWVGRSKYNFGSFHLWGDVPALMPSAQTLRMKMNPDGTNHPQGSWFAVADSKDRGARKPDGLPPLNGHDDPRRGRSTNGSWFAIGANGKSNLIDDGRKVPGMNFHEHEKTGQPGRSFQGAAVADTFGWSKESPLRNNNSKSSARKAASAQIAKIPFPLSNWIARCYRP